MEPADKIVSDLPEAIQNQCHEFITKYRKKQQEKFALSKILTHDNITKFLIGCIMCQSTPSVDQRQKM